MNKQEFSYRCGFGFEFWPCLYWGAGVEAGLKWLALIQEDHTFTFKTVEQRLQRDSQGRVFNPNAHLSYGP
jgi:hypothetical protein